MKTNYLKISQLLLLMALFSSIVHAQTLTSGLDFINGSLLNTVNGVAAQQTGSALTFTNDAFNGQANSAISLNGDVLNTATWLPYSTGKTDKISVAFWFKTNDNSTIEKEVINNYNQYGWKFTLQNGKLKLNSRFNCIDGSSTRYSPEHNFTTTFLADNQWHFVVLTMEESWAYGGAANYLRVRYKTFIDGVQKNNVQKQKVWTGSQYTIPVSSGLYIGDNKDKNGSRYTGEIDNINIYSGLLTNSQIISMYRDPMRIYVNVNATGNNDGSSWVDAYTGLKTATEAANASGDEIWVAQGTYTPDASSKIISFSIQEGVNIYGGFDGTETQLTDRDWRVNETILSGDLNADDNITMTFDEVTRSDNSYVIMRLRGNGSNIVDGFTFSGGNANHASNSSYNKGAGIFKDNSVKNVEVKNCIFKNNVAIIGSGIYGEYQGVSSFIISHCIFDNNIARYGASYIARNNVNGTTTITIDNSLFINNESKDNGSPNGFSGSGGMIATNGSAVINTTIVNCTYADNKENGTASQNVSAGILVTARYGGTMNTNIYNSIFWNNSRLSNVGQANSLGRMNAGYFSNTLNFSNNIVPELNVSSYGLTVLSSNNANQDPNWIPSGPWKYYLYTSSIAINSGNNAYVINESEGDLKGNIRIADAIVDMGTYESNLVLHTLITSVVGSGSVSPSGTTTHNDGAVVGITATPATGWEFSNWTGDASGTSNPLNVTMDANKSIEAVFTQIQRTLTTTVSGSGSVSPSGTTTHNDGAVVGITATPVTGWEFSNWTGDASGTSNPLNVTMDANKFIEAVFTQIQYELTILVTNGSATPNSGTLIGGVYTYNSGTPVTITAVENSGYVFARFEITDSNGTTNSTINPLNITMYDNNVVEAIFNSTAGINDAIKVDFTIYPNPVKDIVHIQLNTDLKHAIIYDILGKEVIFSSIKNIDVSHLNKGVFFIKLETTTGNTAVKRFVKK